MEMDQKSLPNDTEALQEMVLNFQQSLLEKESSLEEKENNLLTQQILLLEKEKYLSEKNQIIETQKNDLLENKNLITYQKTEIENLRHRLNKQLQHRFGNHSEKFVDQVNLFDEADLPQEKVEEVEKADESITVAAHQRKQTGRKPLPKNLPRKEVIHDLADDEKICGCGNPLHKIGEDRSEQLAIIPARMKVLVHVRCKYGCRKCEMGVKMAPLPKQPIPKSIATSGLLAHVMVSKYADHLPLYRQERMLQRMGVDIARMTLSNWMVKCSHLLEPLVELLKEIIIKSGYVQADETTLQVLNEPDRENKQKSTLWAYRAAGPPEKVAVVFDYQPTRSGECAAKFLADFNGLLQTDGYGGYNELRARGDIIAAGCWAHARRKFMDIVKDSKVTGKAHEAVSMIAKLYRIETEARDKKLTAEKRLALREEKSRPIVEKFKVWIDKSLQQVPPKSPIGQALSYAFNQWKTLTTFLEVGECEIDNNGIENAIRPFAIGRKNWLFAGSVSGAKASAIIYSLLQTSKAHELEPYAYLKVVMEKIVHCENEEDYRKLLPQNIDRDALKNAYL